MFNETLLLTAVLAPTAGAFLLPMTAVASVRLRNGLAVALVCVSLACSLGMVPTVAAGTTVTAGHWPHLGLPSAFVADGLAVFTACVSSLVSAVVLFYSLGYIRNYPHQNEYYLMVVLFLGAMMGLVFSGNLLLLYVFWEVTAIASWRLIGFFREKQHVVWADKAFLVTAFGALAMLLGFISIYVSTGSMDLAALKNAAIPDLTVALLLMGMFSKSATLPFHTWLPDAGVAPSPVTALLHAAVLVKIGVYVYARLFIVTFPLSAFWHTSVLTVAAASALVSAAAALVDTDLKRILAYSTVSQIGFIFLGFAGGSEIGVAGAMLFILMHGLAKGGLFLCAGIVEQRTHLKDISRMGGLIRTMPITAISFLFCALSVMGIPPFGGFFSKYMVMSGAIQGGHLWIAMTFLVGAFLTILYLFRLFNLVFLGEVRAPAREGSAVMVGCVAVLALLSLAGGLFIRPPSQFVLSAIQQMPGFMR
jgi:NADH:ubiquinone oxidoreductase subunit 5 (subunit L)/multisubunit Na+/H+ antiporter MnhA subunit